MNAAPVRLFGALVLCLVLFSEPATAQLRGRHGPPPPPIVAPPIIMPATYARQSALPLVAPPVSPILNRNVGLGRSGFGGFGGFYSPWGGNWNYPQSNFIFNYGLPFPWPYFPPQSLTVPPPAPNTHPNSAMLTLSVPSGAEVSIGGKKVEISGTRTFESPDLNSGETYTFDVRVVWKENGKEVVEKRALTMHAGDHQSLQYLAVPSSTLRLER